MISPKVIRNGRRKLWCMVILAVFTVVVDVVALNGPNVCMVKQRYNITKRVKYRAPMSVRTYEWCFSIPPRCSKWYVEMRDLTRLETEERTAEVAVCCPGYKMRDVSCVPICPNGRTGVGCSDACSPNKWGPNCVNDCGPCEHGSCSAITGECRCRDGWQGESCEINMPPITISTMKVDVLTETKISSISTTTPVITTTRTTTVENTTTPRNETTVMTTTIKNETPFIPISEFHNMMDNGIEGTTEYINVLNPIKLITSTHAQKSITATTEAENIMETHNPTILINNNKEKPFIPEKVKVTLMTTKINSTAVEKSDVITTKSPTPFERTDSTYDPQFIKKIVVVEQKRNKEFKLSDITTNNIKEKENDIFTSTAVSPTLIPTAIYSTIKPNSRLVSINTENSNSFPLIIKENIEEETTRNPEVTVKFSSTVKLKPKEIWIKPALKSEMVESKKSIYDVAKHRIVTNKESIVTTTPKTIIVSIIPTSVSYATFKKIALTTASYLSPRNHTLVKSHKKIAGAFTKPIELTSTTIELGLTTPKILNTNMSVIFSDVKSTPTTKKVVTSMFSMSEPVDINKTELTNTSMSVGSPVYNSDSHVSKLSSKAPSYTDYQLITKRMKSTGTTPSTISLLKTENTHNNNITEEYTNLTKSTTHNSQDDEIVHSRKHTKNLTSINRLTTEDPSNEEIFHILTEPEHITAVMGEKERGRTSMDLVSVVSIAGGVMMAIITVAVIIVMIERCKRPRYEDVRKINDIHMQVMLDNNDAPPPYVRSIFHTPLPDPPISEKCHYQPISTLDRNLKQFMRPVVVQTISPIMLENFRGILECHYDHLPRRSHDFAIDACCTTAPSVNSNGELLCIQHNNSTIEALKCEARMDVIDTTTSEPLYAEIPCWRPSPEHAIVTLNVNGEAITEL